MVKILLAILLSSFLSTSIVSCSFLKSDSDETAQEVTESDDEGFGDEDEDYDPLNDEDSDVAALDDSGEDFEDDDDLEEGIEDNFGDESEDIAAVEDTTGEVSDDDLLGEDIIEEPEQVAAADTVSDNADDLDLEDPSEVEPTALAENEVPSTDQSFEQPAPEDFSAQENVDLGYNDEPVVKNYVSVKKAKVTPFNKAGVLANAIYIARPGDTLSSISQKIYGSDRTSDLLSVNTTLGRGVKVGDKVYYNSPQRPNDRDTLQTYYEDLNLSPEIYVTQPGDNIRSVSKKLLGNAGSWKEVWATNQNIESKGEVSEGLELRYWSDGGAGAPTNLASNNIPPPAPVIPEPPQEEFDVPPPPPQEEFNPPPPPQPIAQNNMDKIPPPPEEFAEDSIPPPPEPIEEVIPPPPPIAKTAPPPPPRVNAPPPPPMPKVAKKKSFGKKAKSLASMADRDQTMMMGALGIILLAAVLLFIIIRKKRSRKAIDFNTSTTQIE